MLAVSALTLSATAGSAAAKGGADVPLPPAGPAAAVVQLLAHPATPHDDLRDSLDTLATAPDAATVAAARQLALDILEGNPLPGKPYSGIPLLNWNLPARVKTVPAGGNVTVTEVRAGQ